MRAENGNDGAEIMVAACVKHVLTSADPLNDSGHV